MTKEKIALILLKLSVAFPFLYAAIAGFITPDNWIGYFPHFVQDIFPNQNLLLDIFGAVQIIVALWILFGKEILIPSILATLMLLGIIVFNLNVMDIMFRDIGLMFAALALAIYNL